jgi:hypothetical protein
MPSSITIYNKKSMPPKTHTTNKVAHSMSHSYKRISDTAHADLHVPHQWADLPYIVRQESFPAVLGKISGATTCKNERRMQWRFKTATPSLIKHIDLAQRLSTITRPQKPKHNVYIKVEERLLNWVSYSAGTQTSGTRLQATREATRRLIHSPSATSANNYKFILLSVTMKWLKRSTCMPYIWLVSDSKSRPNPTLSSEHL